MLGPKNRRKEIKHERDSFKSSGAIKHCSQRLEIASLSVEHASPESRG